MRHIYRLKKETSEGTQGRLLKSLLGIWELDLRPTPESEPYLKDFEIKGFTVSSPKISGGKATVTVKFQNFEKRETVSYQLVKEKKGWKISDIKYADGSSLLGYFKEDAKQNQ